MVCHGHPAVVSASHPEVGTGVFFVHPAVGIGAFSARLVAGIGGSFGERQPAGMVWFFGHWPLMKVWVLLKIVVMVSRWMRFWQRHSVETMELVF